MIVEIQTENRNATLETKEISHITLKRYNLCEHKSQAIYISFKNGDCILYKSSRITKGEEESHSLESDYHCILKKLDFTAS